MRNPGIHPVFSCLLLATNIFLFSDCAQKSDPLGPEGPSEVFSFTLNGSSISYSGCCSGYYDSTQDHTVVWGAPALLAPDVVYFVVPGNLSGTYINGMGVTYIGHSKNTNEYSSDLGDAFIDLQSYGDAGSRIEGTFHGNLQDPATGLVESVTNGIFSVIREDR